jgi:protein required for attachment to host cells
MKKQMTWVVVADGARARVLKTTDCISYDLVREQSSPDALLPTRELVSDKPGRVHESAASARHAVQSRSDPQKRAKEKFLRTLAAGLDEAHRLREFDSLVLVAPPSALGTLRKVLSNSTKTRLRAELTSDLTKVPTHDLAKHLGKLG